MMSPICSPASVAAESSNLPDAERPVIGSFGAQRDARERAIERIVHGGQRFEDHALAPVVEEDLEPARDLVADVAGGRRIRERTELVFGEERHRALDREAADLQFGDAAEPSGDLASRAAGADRADRLHLRIQQATLVHEGAVEDERAARADVEQERAVDRRAANRRDRGAQCRMAVRVESNGYLTLRARYLNPDLSCSVIVRV